MSKKTVIILVICFLVLPFASALAVVEPKSHQFSTREGAGISSGVYIAPESPSPGSIKVNVEQIDQVIKNRSWFQKAVDLGLNAVKEFKNAISIVSKGVTLVVKKTIRVVTKLATKLFKYTINKTKELIFGKPYGAPPIDLPKTRNEREEFLAHINYLKANIYDKSQKLTESERGKVNESINKLDQDIDALVHAILSQNAYESGSSDQVEAWGWHRLTSEDLKVLQFNPEDFSPKESGFRSVLFIRYEPKAQLALAYKGTSVNSFSDWSEDGIQGLGFKSDYYQRAKTTALIVKAYSSQNQIELSITGHSLGGGMAATACIVTNSRCTTFNAAGVHPNTVQGLSLNSQTKTYVVRGEALNGIQDSLVMKSLRKLPWIGKKLPLPAAVGERVSVPAVDSSGKQKYFGLDNSILGPILKHPAEREVDGLRQTIGDEKSYLEGILIRLDEHSSILILVIIS